MEMIKLSVLAFALYVQVSVATEPSSVDRNIFSAHTWQDGPSDRVALDIADLVRRSKTQHSQQFHGLMGRSSGSLQPVRLGRKRNKGEVFVGLMGRRSSSGGFQEKWEKQQY